MNSKVQVQKKPLDKSLLLLFFCLLGIGLVQVYSSSFIYAMESYGDGLFFFRKQLIFAAISVVALITVANIPWKWIERTGLLIWMLSAFAVALTLVPGIGLKVGGAARWIPLFSGIQFEPSEPLKISLSFLIAAFLHSSQPQEWSRGKWASFLIALVVPLGLLLQQPDFGSFAICVTVLFSLIYIQGLRWRWVVTAATLSTVLFYLLIWMKPYRKARVLSYLDPWADPAKGGFQIIQSQLSFYSGGLFGQGLGQGQGKLFFLPEAHTDFTFAVLGEEVGFLGVCGLLLLYAWVIVRGFQIALRSKTTSLQLVALGITMTFAIQVLINLGVVLGIFPTKGLSLPFLSYGGSHLLMMGFAFGVLLNIARLQPKEASIN